jgi:hypothetical protein
VRGARRPPRDLSLGYKTAPAEAGFGRWEAGRKSPIEPALFRSTAQAKFLTAETAKNKPGFL